MYRVDRNDFYKEQKESTIYTPPALSHFIYDILKDKITKDMVILDPCVGGGNLIKPFVDNQYQCIGVDPFYQGFENTIVKNYLETTIEDYPIKPSCIMMNPPFNIDEKTKEYIKNNYGGRPLLTELWLQKTIELFGKDIPILLITPYGFRLNLTMKSKRYKRFLDGTYPDITSIISLPKNIFEGVLFHTEIYIFNVNGIKPHYFYDDANQK